MYLKTLIDIKLKTTESEVQFYLKKLFPINRSLTGNGNRETLAILEEITPLNIIEYPTGKVVYDWEIPKEWNIRDAWIKNAKGEKVIDFVNSNLHVVGYSTPINAKLKGSVLKKNLHYLTDQPDLIPYKTSYYNENWGFCLTYEAYKELFNDEETYEVFIDSELKSGSLSLADCVLKGEKKDEYIFSTYFCHPSLANDNLSGTLMNAFLLRELKGRKLKNTYRFVFAPETIGVIAYCAAHEKEMHQIQGGYVLTCLAGQGRYGYKNSFAKNHIIDKIARQTLKEKQTDFIAYPFVPQGSDERQYSSPGFRIPIGSVHKDKYHEYPYYHTSGDDLAFVTASAFMQTLEIYLDIIEKLENNTCFFSLNPHCEPRLGKRDLYPSIGRRTMYTYHEETIEHPVYLDELDIIMWLLFYADGENSLIDIAEKHNFHFSQLHEVLTKLVSKGLVVLK